MAIFSCCGDIDVDSPRNIIVSVVSGFLFAFGWWIMIDAACMYTSDQLPHAYHAIGVFVTIAFFLINLVPNHVLQDDFSSGGLCHRKCAYGFLFFAFLIAFSCVIASAWILFGAYVAAGKTPTWPGVAILLQSLLICTASFLYRFGRKHEEY